MPTVDKLALPSEALDYVQPESWLHLNAGSKPVLSIPVHIKEGLAEEGLWPVLGGGGQPEERAGMGECQMSGEKGKSTEVK